MQVDESQVVTSEKKADPYKQVFVGPGKQILILYASEYGFGEVSFFFPSSCGSMVS